MLLMFKFRPEDVQAVANQGLQSQERQDAQAQRKPQLGGVGE